jgi:hypothetical protein
MSDLQVNSPLVDNQLGIGGKGKVYFDNDSPRRRDRGPGNMHGMYTGKVVDKFLQPVPDLDLFRCV